jgi:hypothetical protein
MDRGTLRAVLVAVLIFIALCAARDLVSPPDPNKPRNGIIGWILRGVVWHTIWGEPETPDEAPSDGIKEHSPLAAPSRAIAGGQELPDYAKGW